jgi:hypothetical protein
MGQGDLVGCDGTHLYLLSWLDSDGARLILADDADDDEDAPRSERLTSPLTVGVDLGKRSSAQRWAGPYSHGGSQGFKSPHLHPTIPQVRAPSTSPGAALSSSPGPPGATLGPRPTRWASRTTVPVGAGSCSPWSLVPNRRLMWLTVRLTGFARLGWLALNGWTGGRVSALLPLALAAFAGTIVGARPAVVSGWHILSVSDPVAVAEFSPGHAATSGQVVVAWRACCTSAGSCGQPGVATGKLATASPVLVVKVTTRPSPLTIG